MNIKRQVSVFVMMVMMAFSSAIQTPVARASDDGPPNPQNVKIIDSLIVDRQLYNVALFYEYMVFSALIAWDFPSYPDGYSTFGSDPRVPLYQRVLYKAFGVTMPKEVLFVREKLMKMGMKEDDISGLERGIAQAYRERNYADYEKAFGPYGKTKYGQSNAHGMTLGGLPDFTVIKKEVDWMRSHLVKESEETGFLLGLATFSDRIHDYGGNSKSPVKDVANRFEAASLALKVRDMSTREALQILSGAPAGFPSVPLRATEDQIFEMIENDPDTSPRMNLMKNVIAKSGISASHLKPCQRQLDF